MHVFTEQEKSCKSSKELISTEILSKMLVTSYTPAEKDMIVVKAVRNCIKIAPTKFDQFLQILIEQAMTKSLVDGLCSNHQNKLSRGTSV